MTRSIATSRFSKGMGILLALAVAPVFSAGGWAPERSAHAIIGMPLTPMSYAGVARRTARRTAYVGAAAATTAVVGTAAAAATVATLPPGCIPSGGVYGCGGTYYRPYYQGPNVVYQVVPGP
jgi:hypothetical protein